MRGFVVITRPLFNTRNVSANQGGAERRGGKGREGKELADLRKLHFVPGLVFKERNSERQVERKVEETKERKSKDVEKKVKEARKEHR